MEKLMSINYRDLFSLFYLYFKYIQRKVFNFGILKSNFVKFIILIVFCLFLFLFSWIWYLVFKEMMQLRQNYLLIINNFAVSSILISCVIFSTLKVFFSKSSTLINFTYYFPVSKKVRQYSLLLFELLFTNIGIILFFIPMITGIFFNMKFDYSLSILNVVFLFITTINFLNLIYYLLLYVLEKIPINKYLKSLVVLVGIFYFTYSVCYHWSNDLIVSYPNIPNFTNLSVFYLLIFNNIGLVYGIIVFLIINFSIVNLLFCIPENYICDNQKFLSINIFNMNLFTAYVKQVVTLKETLITGVFTLTFYFMLVNLKVRNAFYILLLLVIVGFYSYAYTEKIRNINKTYNSYNSIQDYLYMVGALILVMLMYSLPVIITELVINAQFNILVYFKVMIYFVLYVIMISIMFPTFNDNPFGIIIGMGVSIFITAILIFLALVVKNEFFLFFTLISSLIFMVGSSLYYLRKEDIK